MKTYISRKLHQLTSNDNVIEQNRRSKDSHRRQRICITEYSPVEYEELVFLEPKDFELIFRTRDGENKIKGLPIVKIMNPHNGKYVYRAFRTSHEIRGFKDYAGVSYTAIKQISDNSDELNTIDKVYISRGYQVLFYWNHPNHATRIAIRMGTISIILGVISIGIPILMTFVGKY